MLTFSKILQMYTSLLKATKPTRVKQKVKDIMTHQNQCKFALIIKPDSKIIFSCVNVNVFKSRNDKFPSDFQVLSNYVFFSFIS